MHQHPKHGCTIALCLAGLTGALGAMADAGTAVYSPYADRDYPSQVLFGDVHVHTGLSADAGGQETPEILLQLEASVVRAQGGVGPQPPPGDGATQGMRYHIEGMRFENGASSVSSDGLVFLFDTVDELMAISEKMLEEQHYQFAEGTREVMRKYLQRRTAQPHFANARSVRNALDRARLRQASRLFADRDRELTRDDLTSIAPQDLLASRVFQDNQ